MTRTDRTADPAAATREAMNWYVIGRGNSAPCKPNASAAASASPTPIRSRRASPSAVAATSMKNRSRRPGPSWVPRTTPVIVTGTSSAMPAAFPGTCPFQGRPATRAASSATERKRPAGGA